MDLAMALANSKVDYYKYMDIKGWGLYKQGKARKRSGFFKKHRIQPPSQCIR